ncbi:MAG: tryptophan--tRNA ligase [Elusimicrobia bacterium]|nr:tryptophan--tRNA ligase [Elusimicrobiota bacterium]
MVKGASVLMSGMRPTGRLHVGNYWGALSNWVGLQEKHACYFAVADWHMLTTGYADTGRLQENIREMALDWLAAGLDPEKCVMFKQSAVPEHAELALLLSMITPLSWLENNPTFKEQLQELSNAKDLHTHGFLGYPVLQAADILLYRAGLVPIGHDQLPHVELAREIARRFNSIYGDVLPEPQPLLTETPKIPGTDGRKMSKSYGNAIDIYETADSLKRKVMRLYTDPLKARADDPGHPEPCAENPPGCVAYALHKLYASADFSARRGEECRAGEIGCVACKKDLLLEMEGPFAEFARRREELAGASGLVEKILETGSAHAREAAQNTMREVRRAMKLA